MTGWCLLVLLLGERAAPVEMEPIPWPRAQWHHEHHPAPKPDAWPDTGTRPNAKQKSPNANLTVFLTVYSFVDFLWINVFACGEGRSVRAIPIYIDLYKVHSMQLHSIYHILPNSRAKTVHPAAKIFLHKCAEGSKVAMTLQWQIRSSDRWQIKTRKKNTGCGNRILLPRNPIA